MIFFVAYVTNYPHILIDIFLGVNSSLSKANGFSASSTS